MLLRSYMCGSERPSENATMIFDKKRFQVHVKVYTHTMHRSMPLVGVESSQCDPMQATGRCPRCGLLVGEWCGARVGPLHAMPDGPRLSLRMFDLRCRAPCSQTLSTLIPFRRAPIREPRRHRVSGVRIRCTKRMPLQQYRRRIACRSATE